MSLLDKLVPQEEESVEKILVRLMTPNVGDTPDDIAMKTELPNVLNIVKLQALADWLEKEGLPESSKLVRDFVKNYMHDMVSHGRKGRLEITKAVSNIKEEQRSRWTGKIKEEVEK